MITQRLKAVTAELKGLFRDCERIGITGGKRHWLMVKRFFKEKNGFRLQPENDNMEPFFEKDVTVLGKVIGIYRQM